MSGVDPRASFSQGPGTWRPQNPLDTALGREFAQGVAAGHPEESFGHALFLAALGGTIALNVEHFLRSLR